MNLQTELSDPCWNWFRRRKRQVSRLRKVDGSIGDVTVLVQSGLERSAVGRSSAEVRIVRVRVVMKNAPREAKTSQAHTHGDKQRFEAQVEQKRGEGSP